MNQSVFSKIKSSINIILIWILALYFWDAIQFSNEELSIRHPEYNILTQYIDLTILIGGTLMGLNFLAINWLIEYQKGYFKQMSYGKLILSYSIIHILSFTLISLFVILIFISLTIKDNDLGIELLLKHLIQSHDLLKVVLYTYVVSVTIYFLKLINQKLGPGVLRDLLLGKYRQPKEQEILFLFIDLKSSTTYAELLGHKKYSELIQDCFADLSFVLLQNKATIYQYVGDEVVIIWPYALGVKNCNCINLYFQFRRILADKSEYYKNKYGMIPEFKAGINGGKIMVAEVGGAKRSIAYHGDVINTASRIQHLCNSLGREFLISERVIRDLPQNSSFIFKFISTIKLKGKQMKENIFCVSNIPIN
jgi:adenylate cyclase